jgi:hypothetical protein
MRDWGAEAGFTPSTDYVYVRSVHAESTAALLTLTGSTAEGTTAMVRIISCVGDTTGTSPGNLATGASVTTTGVNDIYINEGVYTYGVEFYSGDDIWVGQNASDQNIHLEACRLELVGTNASDNLYVNYGSAPGAVVLLKNCVLDFGNAGQTLYTRYNTTIIEGGSLGANLTDFMDTLAIGNLQLYVRGFDMSVMTGDLLAAVSSVNATALWQFSRCRVGSGTTFLNGTLDVPGQRAEFFHVQVGTDADPAYQMEIHTSHGKILTDTTRYRTGGAKDPDRTNPISWDFDTTVGSWVAYPAKALDGPPIAAWTDGDASTAHTYRIAFASDATIQDDEIWMELEGPNDAATDSLSVIQTSRVAPLGTPANYTTDAGSTWTGAGVTTKQYMEVTYTPDKPGPVIVRVYMAKASDNIYVDPLIQIDP